MLVMGGNKMREIGASPILARYHQIFEERLCRADSRLMVIGYGFRDSHINEVIMRAINDQGIKMFVIAPEGGELACVANPTNTHPIRVGTNLEAAFERGLMGASRRPLRDISYVRRPLAMRNGTSKSPLRTRFEPAHSFVPSPCGYGTAAAALRSSGARFRRAPNARPH